MEKDPTTISVPHAIYIHIPFCQHICSYCAFNVHPHDADQQEAFIQALCHEITIIARKEPNLHIASISFGGGTPSLLTCDQITRIMEHFNNTFAIPHNIEISLEANPNDITPQCASTWRRLGFNRISLGMQASQQPQLTLFERQHDHATVIEAVTILHQAELTNINLDLIFGVPDQTLDQWQQTLHDALALKPTHLSLYGLELHGGTTLTKAIRAGQIAQPDDDLAADMYDLACTLLASKGFTHYEISNWSRPNYESSHNLQYWRNQPYLGLGAGAHGYANGYRTINRRHPDRYVQALTQTDGKSEKPFPHTPAIAKFTPVTSQDQISETIMMGLRLTQEGINRPRFHERFGEDITRIKKEPLEQLVQKGLIEITQTSVRLTPSAYLLANYVLRDLI